MILSRTHKNRMKKIKKINDMINKERKNGNEIREEIKYKDLGWQKRKRRNSIEIKFKEVR